MLELFMPTRKVFKGKVSDELRMETKRISKERAELQERMEARARELQKQLDEKFSSEFEVLEKAHAECWEKITQQLGIDPDQELTMDLRTGRVYAVEPCTEQEEEEVSLH